MEPDEVLIAGFALYLLYAFIMINVQAPPLFIYYVCKGFICSTLEVFWTQACAGSYGNLIQQGAILFETAAITQNKFCYRKALEKHMIFFINNY